MSTMVPESVYAAPPPISSTILAIFLVAVILFIVFLWFYLSPLCKDKNALAPRFKLFSRQDLEANQNRAMNLRPDATLPVVMVDGHQQYRLLTLLSSQPGGSKPAERGDYHNRREARHKSEWSWQTFGSGKASSNGKRSTLVSLDSDWCSEITLKTDEDIDARREWKMKYWKAREKQQELMEERRQQEADKTPRARFDFSMVPEEDRVCLFSYQSESGQSTPNVLSPKQPIRSPPNIGPVKNSRIRTLLPNTAFSQTPHFNYSRALAGDTPLASTPTRLGIGYGYERQIMESTSPLGPPFGGNANLCAYTQQFNEPPPAYQSPMLGSISARQGRPIVVTPTPRSFRSGASPQSLARTPTQKRPTNPFLSPNEEAFEQHNTNTGYDTSTRIINASVLPTVNEEHDSEISRSRSCPSFSVIYDEPPYFDHLPTSTPFKRDEKQGDTSTDEHGDDGAAELNISGISSIGSRLYDIHIGASVKDDESSGSDYSPPRGINSKNGTVHRNGTTTSGIAKRFSSASDLAGFLARGRKTFATYKPFNAFTKTMGRANGQVDEVSK